MLAKLETLLARFQKADDDGGADETKPVPYSRFAKTTARMQAAETALGGLRPEIEAMQARHASELAAVRKQLADHASAAELRRQEDVGFARAGLDEVGIATVRAAWQREPEATRGKGAAAWWEAQVAAAKEHAADEKRPAPTLHPTVAVLLPKFEAPEQKATARRGPLPEPPGKRPNGGALVRGEGRAALLASMGRGGSKAP